MMRRSRKKWRERLHLHGKVASSLSVLMVAVIIVFVMVTTVNCGNEAEATTKTYVFTTNEGVPSNPVATMQQAPSQLSSVLSPQNFMSSGNQANFLPSQQGLMSSGPPNFLQSGQSLFSQPAGFFQGAQQNSMSAPFSQGAQSFMQQSPPNFPPAQGLMSGDNANMFSRPASMFAASPNTIASGANQSPANLLMAPASAMQSQVANQMARQSQSPNKLPSLESGNEETKDMTNQFVSYGQDQKSKYHSQAISYKHSSDFSEFKQSTSNLIPTTETPPAQRPPEPTAAQDDDQSKTTAKPISEGEPTTMRVLGGF